MSSPANVTQRQRVDFSKIKTSVPIPNLIEVQKQSYERFLQMDLLPAERDDSGLQSVFASVFPISDFRGLSQLDFVDYSIGNWECKCGNLKGLHNLRSTCRSCGSIIKTDPFHPGDIHCDKCGTFNKNVVTFCNRCGDPVGLQLKYEVPECEERSMTYAAPLKVTIRLTVFDKDPDSGNKSVRDIKEQEVFFGEIPLMTDNGTFIINGTERVIVSQLHRSPGVFFERVQAQGYFLGKIIPYRGSWVEFEYDNKNLLYVRIDRKRKFYGTVFLRAMGLKTDEQILRTFYTDTATRISIGKDNKLFWQLAPQGQPGRNALKDIKLSYAVTTKTGDTVIAAGKKITNRVLGELAKSKVEQFEVAANDLEGAYALADVIDMSTGEIVLEANKELTPASIGRLIDAGIESFEIFFPERDEAGNVLSRTLEKDSVKVQAEALLEIYRKLRPGDPPTLDTATQLFNGMFFDPRKYDFSRVGRMKFNIKLYDNSAATPLDKRTLDHKDFVDTIQYLFRLRKGIGVVDDIDHLGNRRVRAVGELLENQFRIGLVRMERAIKEKMSVFQEIATAMPHDLVNAKPVMAAIREFFGSSQLSQFMDQTNPLSEITHKRRLSALGPGGLSRERAGFEVRDVHPTHYGRICPIETPEGPNIGLISSLSCFARINEYGFIESPYRRVVDCTVVDEVKVLNPGGTSLKVGQVLLRAEAEALNGALGADKQPAELEAHCDYLSAWEEDKYIV
ncbi:MAG: DNA-directed RNA polymerase subunit beta, partial [Acidobacteriaceae bacterium]|nr:DNA-directed RNA polymerase subunit beta [Acidobacteriaceae bacterium]